MKILETKKEVIKTETITHDLGNGLSYEIVKINNKISSSSLKTSKLHRTYNLDVLYDIDVELLKTTNIFTTSDSIYNNFFINNKLPKVENINESKIFYVCHATHDILDHNMKIIHMPLSLDYIQGNFSNEKYNLKELREHLLTLPNIISVSEIKQIPYYNASEDRKLYLHIVVLPTDYWYETESGYNPKESLLFNLHNHKYDPMKIKQFIKESYLGF